jgi:hypothetical protein
MKLVARNESGKALKIRVAGPDWMVMADFKVVRVTDGHVVNLRPYRDDGERQRRFVGHSTVIEVIPMALVSPGFVNLRNLFELAPGAYNVSADCKLTSPDYPNKLVSVPSNQITVSVVK